MVHILQPQGSALCGQTCIAMAAGVSIERATEAVGHGKARGTYTNEVIAGLRALGIQCAPRLRALRRNVPNLPRRGIVAMRRPGIRGKRRELGHWVLTWDGVIYDPGGCWPDGYKDWVMTSYLEIFS